ncbi:cystathionine gamma-lyase-like isoform X8 [Phyllopteryx taeniolatus]|uniref:cystathionine gamma-lyase-like isoform X8 n=1 Tax=Phyllopteryx taeniolatus TaxID=161469 RepID=UPI002AD267ED|nr:cystathionine gamma-lyase-like isoform X8 [Phyllopteryx taeniolatus]
MAMENHIQGDRSDLFAGFGAAFKSFATDAIHVGQEPEQWTSRAVVPPISLSTTFKQTEPGKHSGYEYSRSGNPTRDCLEKAVAALDGAKHCLAVASGLAATVTITHMLKAGDGIICMDDVYGGTNRYFQRVAAEFGLQISLVDCTKLELLKAALKPNTKRPLSFGADICMYSATKYMNGHSDVVMGLVSVNREDLYDRLKFLQNALGGVPSPFDCFLVNRGLKTLHLRMECHFKNAMATAKFLEADSRVECVIYPGLPSHPQYEVVKRQCTGCPGIITFYIKGKLQHANTFLKSLKMFSVAESLGGYESLAEQPAIMTHASVPEKERNILGISDTLIRLSVGLEDEADIIEDLDQALAAAAVQVFKVLEARQKVDDPNAGRQGRSAEYQKRRRLHKAAQIPVQTAMVDMLSRYDFNWTQKQAEAERNRIEEEVFVRLEKKIKWHPHEVVLTWRRWMPEQVELEVAFFPAPDPAEQLQLICLRRDPCRH